MFELHVTTMRKNVRVVNAIKIYKLYMTDAKRNVRMENNLETSRVILT
jgi:hypothetical protein